MSKETPKREDAEVREAPADPNAVVMPATPIVSAQSAPSESTTEVQAPAGTKTPLEHVADLKGVKTVKRAARINNEPETFEIFHWQHAAAEALHGWKDHEHHAGAAIQLSREDYEAALIAASAPVTRRVDRDGKPYGDPVDSHEAAAKGWLVVTDYEPHKPALSTHKGQG